jgi:hypothetical protein
MADTGSDYRELDKLVEELDKLSRRLEEEGQYVNAGLVWEAAIAIVELDTAVKLMK